MPNFSYKALGRDGKEVRGVLQAESEAAAASRIRENYPILLSISQKKEKKRPDDGSLLEMEIGSRRIKTKKLAILCSQFAITLHSGMTVARAMRMLAAQNEDKRIRKIMGAAAEEVAAGSTVASALEKYSDRFPLTFIETIRAGEQSGTLERSFDRLQKFYEKSYKTTEKIKGAMTYPLFVVAIAVVVLIIVMAKVIPTLADVFTDLGGTLPLMTRMLIATSHFFAKWWLLMLAVLVFLKIGSQVYGNTPQGRIQKAKIALSLPLVGVINQMNGAAQFANTMSVLLAAGITINQAVDTTAKAAAIAAYLTDEDVTLADKDGKIVYYEYDLDSGTSTKDGALKTDFAAPTTDYSEVTDMDSATDKAKYEHIQVAIKISSDSDSTANGTEVKLYASTKE